MISAAQLTISLGDIQFQYATEISEDLTSFSDTILLTANKWSNIDVPLPDDTTASFIYAYLTQYRSTSDDAVIDVVEIEAYAPFYFGNNSFMWYSFIPEFYVFSSIIVTYVLWKLLLSLHHLK